MYILPPKTNLGSLMGQGIAQGTNLYAQLALPYMFQQRRLKEQTKLMQEDLERLKQWQLQQQGGEMGAGAIPMPQFQSPQMLQSMAESMTARKQAIDVGEHKGIFNPATGQIEVTELPSARVPSTQISIKQPPAKMLEDMSTLYDMQNQVSEIASLFEEKETFWGGRWENAKAKYGLANLPVVGDIVTQPTERGILFRQIVDTIKEDLARKRSGGQITASEYERLNDLLPGWQLPADTFKAKLKGFAKALDRTVASKRRILSEAGYIVPGETEVQAPQSVRTPTAPQYKEGQSAVNPTTGQRIIFRNGAWQPME